MRYAALVSFADSVDFGSYHVLSPGTKRVQARLSDEALYALALYIYSLKPPPNPNPPALPSATSSGVKPLLSFASNAAPFDARNLMTSL